MVNNEADIEIIGEDHQYVAGITLLRRRALNQGSGYVAMVEWPSHINDIIQAYNDDKLSKAELTEIFYSYSDPNYRKRTPQLVDMLEELKAHHISVIAYDVRDLSKALNAGMEPQTSFLDRWSKYIQRRSENGEEKSELDRDEKYVATVAKYWHYSPITKQIEDLTRESWANGINNEDVIAARVIDKFHQIKSTILAGALHIDGEFRPDIRAYGIVDDALRKLGHRVETSIVVDHTGDLMRSGYVSTCATAEVIGSYIVIDPVSGTTKETYHDNESLRKALEQVKMTNEKYQFRLPDNHLGNCTPDKYPAADQHPEFSKVLQKLGKPTGKDRPR